MPEWHDPALTIATELPRRASQILLVPYVRYASIDVIERLIRERSEILEIQRWILVRDVASTKAEFALPGCIPAKLDVESVPGREYCAVTQAVGDSCYVMPVELTGEVTALPAKTDDTPQIRLIFEGNALERITKK